MSHLRSKSASMLANGDHSTPRKSSCCPSLQLNLMTLLLLVDAVSESSAAVTDRRTQHSSAQARQQTCAIVQLLSYAAGALNVSTSVLKAQVTAAHKLNAQRLPSCYLVQPSKTSRYRKLTAASVVINDVPTSVCACDVTRNNAETGPRMTTDANSLCLTVIWHRRYHTWRVITQQKSF